MTPIAAGLGRFPIVEEPPQDVHDGIGAESPAPAVADDMARVATIETTSIVPTMLALGFS